MKLTQKQERFTLEYFKTGNATQSAITAQYSPKTAVVQGSRLLTNANVIALLEQLRKRAEDDSVMSVLERKQRLSEIGRARIADFVRCEAGVAHITLDLESANSAAIQEITTDHVRDGRGEDAVSHEVTKLKLRDQVQAITELNKMEKIYEPESKTVNYNDIKILVVYDDKGNQNSLAKTAPEPAKIQRQYSEA
jgi:phage terminase small subunit